MDLKEGTQSNIFVLYENQVSKKYIYKKITFSFD